MPRCKKRAKPTKFIVGCRLRIVDQSAWREPVTDTASGSSESENNIHCFIVYMCRYDRRSRLRNIRPSCLSYVACMPQKTPHLAQQPWLCMQRDDDLCIVKHRSEQMQKSNQCGYPNVCVCMKQPPAQQSAFAENGTSKTLSLANPTIVNPHSRRLAGSACDRARANGGPERFGIVRHASCARM